MKRTFKTTTGRIVIESSINISNGKNRDYNSLEEIEGEITRISFTGEIFEGRRSSRYGQCDLEISDLIPYVSNTKDREDLIRILTLWQDWHLNDVKAGTDLQTAAISQAFADEGQHDYGWQCSYLLSKGIYNDRGYKYGTSWLYKQPSKDVINQINNLFQEGE